MTTTYNPGHALPAIDWLTPGVLQWDKDPYTGRITAVFQCHDCHLVEKPAPHILTDLLFHPVAGDGQRRCRPCRIAYRAANFPDCKCRACGEDAQ